MSVISTNNTNPLAPIDRTSETNPLISRFNQQSIDIYAKFSIYQDGTRRRDSEPFLFTDLNQPNSVKLRRKNDSQTLPFRSALDDIQRMSRFLRSGRGLLFSAQQFLIQNQNAFNETRVWNPASILTAAGSTSLLRIRPLRHIETSGDIGGILTNFLRGSIGLTPKDSPPRGTAIGEGDGKTVISLTAASPGLGNPFKGLVRYDTATRAQYNFDLKYGDSTKKGDFSKIIDNFLRTLPFARARTKTADWKLRPEYGEKEGKNVYAKMLSDKGGLLSFKKYAAAGGFTTVAVSSVHKYTPNNNYIIRGELPLTQNRRLKSVYENVLKSANNPIALVTAYPFTIKESFTLKEEDDKEILGEQYIQRLNVAVVKFKETNRYDEITTDFFKPTVLKYVDIPNSSNDKKTFEKNQNSLETNRGFSSVGKPDEINILFPLEENEDRGPGIPFQLQKDGNSKDLIYFYFYDVANKVYLPFRATIDSISDNNAVEWEDFQYIGRADHLYIYRGFTRDMNFNFTVHANSVFELQPMWHRINYLTGLTRPSKYTTSPLIPTGEFIVPPLVKLRIGDLYVDLPIVIRSVGLTVPDSAIWELTSGKNYSYRGISSADATTAQLPMTCQLQINAAVLEKERSEGGVNISTLVPENDDTNTAKNSKMRFFGKDVKGFEIQKSEISISS
jgi:hypothetical protein